MMRRRRLSALGGLLLWLVRLAFAPASTLTGFRAWVLAECPVAPGRRAYPVVAARRVPDARPAPPARRAGRHGTKTARFLALAEQQHGQLSRIPLSSVAPISARLAPQVDLDPGAARTALRRAVLAAQNTRSTT